MANEWNINLQSMVGKQVRVDTYEGHVREGKLSKFEFRELELNGAKVGYPVEVQLNGEDSIPFIQIRSLALRKK